MLRLLRSGSSKLYSRNAWAPVAQLYSVHGKPADGDGAPLDAVSAPRSGKEHWLDRYFPGTREWLEAQNRRWWIEGVKGRCRQYAQLEGREKAISEYIEKAYRRYLQQHRHRVTDGRSETHLQMACLVLATYKVMYPWVRDDEELLKVIRSHMGTATSPILRALLHASLYFRRHILGQPSFPVLAAMLRTMMTDLGSAFTCQFHAEDSNVCLSITSCLYNDIFSEEGAPQLTACCCCSQDSMWFSGLESHRVSYIRKSWQGCGDPACNLMLSRM